MKKESYCEEMWNSEKKMKRSIEKIIEESERKEDREKPNEEMKVKLFNGSERARERKSVWRIEEKWQKAARSYMTKKKWQEMKWRECEKA